MEDLFKDLPEEVLNKFKENDITLDILSEVNQEYLKELFPSVGLRIKITQLIKKFQHQENDQNINDNFESPSTSTASTITITADENLNGNILDASVELDMNDVDIRIVDLYPKKITYKDFDLENLLRTAPLGNSVLNFYNKHSHLDDKHINRLNEIIVRHLYDHIIQYRLSADEYETLTEKITNLFPNESANGFYKPGIKRNSNIKGSPFASGSLVHKARNIIKRSGEARPIRKRKHEPEQNEIEAKKTDLDEEVNEDVLWLSLHREPWEMVLEKWNLTYNLRRRQNFSTVSEFLKTWPILQHLQSEVLIALDFEKLYPQSVLSLHLKWDIFFEKLLGVRKVNVTDHHAKELISSLDTIESEDAKFCIQISLLAYLIPPRGRVSIKNNAPWKFSILEASEGFLVHVKNPGDIQDTIKSVQDRALKRHQQVQPYLMVEGHSLEEPTNFYLIIDTIRYQFSSAKKAFDCLFKLFHVFSAKYPVQAEYLWILIQKGVYSISTPFDIVPPYIHRILFLLEEKQP